MMVLTVVKPVSPLWVQPVKFPVSKPGLTTRQLPGVVVGVEVGVPVDVTVAVGVAVGVVDWLAVAVAVGVGPHVPLNWNVSIPM